VPAVREFLVSNLVLVLSPSGNLDG
jgi:hypothetical protein